MESWIEKIPMKILKPYTKDILPYLSPYLMLKPEKKTEKNPDNNKISIMLMRKSRTYSNSAISKRVLELLGNLGGDCHDIIGDKQLTQSSMAWDIERIIKFSVPLFNLKVDIFLDDFLPR